MTDFPAAHSMDTTWFAIDRDGRVAAFETGEAGAIPEELPQDSRWEAVDALPIREGVLDTIGYRLMDEYDAPIHAGDLGNDSYVLVFVNDLEGLGDLVEQPQLRVFVTTTGRCLMFPREDRATYAALHDRGACRGCETTWDTFEATGRYAGRGLYQYEHSERFENWIAGPYVRVQIPTRPITSDELPEVIRDVAIRFAGSFADLVEVQPAEHWRCVALSEHWMASDHKTQRAFETGKIVGEEDND